MAKNAIHDYAGQGIALSKRERSGSFMAQYVLGHRQWVRITRDTTKRQWVFARGYEGELTAHEVSRWSFMPGMNMWAQAIEQAARLIIDYKYPGDTTAAR